MKIKFIEVVIGIIVLLLLVSFLTGCNSDKPNPFLSLFTKIGMLNPDISGISNSETSTSK